MLNSRCRPKDFPRRLSPLLHFSLFSSTIALHSLALRSLHRHFGFACNYLLDSDSCSSEDLELEHDFLRPPLENLLFPIDNFACHPARQFSTENSVERKYSFDRKWNQKENLMKRIALALSKQGWDLNFQTSLGIDLDSRCIPRMLNDLFDESLDSALVFYLFRMWRRWDYIGEHKLQIYCTMIHIAVSGNMNHIAMNLLREIVKSNDTVEGGPDFIFHVLWQARRNGGELETVYSMLVFCFAEQGMLDIATKLITWMEKFGFYPSNGVYVAIGFLFKSQFTKKVESDGDLLVKLQSWGAQLSGVTLSLFIHEFCIHGCLGDACKLLYYMPNFGCKADIVAYTIIIDAFCKRGYLKEATSLLFKMTQMGLSPDSTLISSLVHGYCKIGRSEAAMALLTFSACVPDVFMYNSFILTYCQNGDVESAHQLLNVMFELNVVPDSINYTTVIKGYCNLSRINHALKTFAQMHIRGIKPTIVTYAVLVEGHCKIDDIQWAEFVFNTLERDGLLADVVIYNTLIKGYSKKDADVFFHKMLDAGLEPDLILYNTLVHGFCNVGDVLDVGLEPYLILYNILVHEFCNVGDVLDTGLEPNLILYNNILHGFCNVRCLNQNCPSGLTTLLGTAG